MGWPEYIATPLLLLSPTFDDYFLKKCLPQVKEITSGYGPLEIIWFDTPGKMPSVTSTRKLM